MTWRVAERKTTRMSLLARSNAPVGAPNPADAEPARATNVVRRGGSGITRPANPPGRRVTGRRAAGRRQAQSDAAPEIFGGSDAACGSSATSRSCALLRCSPWLMIAGACGDVHLPGRGLRRPARRADCRYAQIVESEDPREFELKSLAVIEARQARGSDATWSEPSSTPNDVCGGS